MFLHPMLELKQGNSIVTARRADEPGGACHRAGHQTANRWALSLSPSTYVRVSIAIRAILKDACHLQLAKSDCNLDGNIASRAG